MLFATSESVGWPAAARSQLNGSDKITLRFPDEGCQLAHSEEDLLFGTCDVDGWPSAVPPPLNGSNEIPHRLPDEVCHPEEYHRKSEFGHPHRDDVGAPFEWFTVADDHGLTDKVAKGVVDSVMGMARGHLHCNRSFKLGGSIKLALTTSECGEDGKHLRHVGFAG